MDIIEKDIDLVEIKNFCLIVKSEFKGNVFLPRLVITDEVTKKSIQLDKLLNFNCIEIEII